MGNRGAVIRLLAVVLSVACLSAGAAEEPLGDIESERYGQLEKGKSETVGRTDVYLANIGEATLVIELLDGDTGMVLWAQSAASKLRRELEEEMR